MLVMLMGKNTMHKLSLPHVRIGNYWLSDKTKAKEKKLINIEGIEGKWQIVSNNYAQIIDLKSININNNMKVTNIKNNITDKVILKEHEMYGIRLKNSDELFILYCSPVYEENFLSLNIKSKKDIYIGKGKDNQISYNNDLVEDKHARIFFSAGKWRIQNLDSKIGTFVNSRIVEGKEKILFNGDVAFIMGLKLIIVADTLYINDPNNKVTLSNEYFSINKQKINISPINKGDEINSELYSEEDFFSRAPRITNVIEREKIKIDAPPQIQDKEDMPLILVLGSSLSMGAMMIVSIITAIDGRLSGTASTKQTIFSLITAGAMLISMIVFPILIAKYNRRKKKRYEEKRQKRYKEYLNLKRRTINKIMEKQRDILFENHISPEECTKIILSRSARLWERKIDDYDFLTVRLGVGDVPLNIDIQYPEEQFAMEDDNLVEILNNIASNSKTLKLAPIVTSLVEKNVSAIIAQDDKKIRRFMQSLIVQLITFQSYEDLRLVFLLKEDKFKNWRHMEMLPHVWNNTKQIRFFAENYDDMLEISKYLEEVIKTRQEHKDKDYKSFMPYYLIITDDYKKIENLKITKEILKSEVNVGFSMLCITNDLMQLPNECKTFIRLDEEEGMMFENEISSSTQTKITFDTSVILFFEKICEEISNIPIRYTASGGNLLPNSYNFLQMYDVGCIEQLNILDRWNKNDSTLSLKAPIGIDGSGLPIVLDIHEKFHGPHGLIAGSTGSGKSEFIITYILSLAINYHPDDVAFILIDYKGGGLAGAFNKRGIQLPHLVGTITNIDTNGLQRALDSIQSELRRRQVIFNEARNMTDEGTIDIYKYQKLYYQGIVREALPHLLIICDEFAELKQQREGLLNELISVSRIGRSLGVHLILATQKPAGIVNDQIRSNSRFSVCLKVQEKTDSNDVIKKPDAVDLKRAGQFYMLVGNDEYFVLGQSAWSGAPYVPSDVTKKKEDTSIQFVSKIGTILKQYDDTMSDKFTNNKGEQLTNIVKYLYEVSEQNNIKTNNLWLEDIPETIFVKELRKKYNIKHEKYNINPIIGEYDDPFNQRQGIVDMDLSNQGNTIIYGNAESGKETLLSTMVYDLITTYNPEEVQIYLLDFGTESLKIYRESPQVGDVVFINDTEKISRFFDIIQKEIKDRKSVLSDYNGDYNLYLKTSGKTMPMILVTINNYEAFSELYENEYEDNMLTLTREGVKCGIVFVVTVSTYSDMRYRLTQNFKQKIALQINNEDAYYNIFEKVGKKRPSHIFGRGLVRIEEDEVYEFQTAKICEAEQYNIHIKETIEKLNKTYKLNAKPIPVIPKRVTFEALKGYVKDISAVPVGITKKDIKVETYNFKKDFINIITSRNIEDAVQFTINILEEVKSLSDTKIVLFDAERIISSKKANLKDEYIKFIENTNKDKTKNILCVIIGIDKFLSDFEDMKNSFNNSLKNIEEDGRYNFILVENVNKLKTHEYDEWYKRYISKDNGIWVGSGLDNQYVITINSDRREIVNNCGQSYGYLIREGFLTLVKLLEMKDSGDEIE